MSNYIIIQLLNSNGWTESVPRSQLPAWRSCVLVSIILITLLNESTSQNSLAGVAIHALGKIVGADERGFDFNDEEKKKFNIWPDGYVPYFIDDFSYDKVLRDKIRLYLNNINQLTSLEFIELAHPPDNDNDRWVFFINRRGQLNCTDYTNKDFSYSGVQKVVLGYDCLGSPDVIAEVVLALAGIPPQHNAPNRDDYIVVHMENIIPDKTKKFVHISDDEWLFHDIKYDFYSAGHYDPFKYTQNGGMTIEPQQEVKESVDELEGLSFKDILKISMMYNYIVKQREKKKINCSELFRPGTKFNDFKKLSEEIMQPMKKPAKYNLQAFKSIRGVIARTNIINR